MVSKHDNLFRLVFADPARAGAWLRSVLPQPLVRAIDWDSLRPAPEKLIRETLQLDEADVVFAARFVDGTWCWILIEHKSYDDRGLDDQVARYVVALRAMAPDPGATLPVPVVTIVLHHSPRHPGKPNPASAAEPEIPDHPATGLPEIIAALTPVIPRFTADLMQRSEADILNSGLAPDIQLTLLCLRFLRQLSPTAANAALLRWQYHIRAVDQLPDRQFSRRVLTALKWYCLSLTEIPPPQLKATFEQLLGRPEEEIMSTADRLLREGEARGVAIGEARGEAMGRARGLAIGEARGEAMGRAKTLRTLIAKRFGPLPAEVEQRIDAASIAELDRLTERILDVASLEDLFGG